MIRHTSYGLSINVRNEDGKYKAEYRQGYWNSITRTNEADGIAEFETEFGVYLKNNVVMEITYNGRKLELSFGFKALNAIDRKLGVEAEQMKFGMGLQSNSFCVTRKSNYFR